MLVTAIFRALSFSSGTFLARAKSRGFFLVYGSDGLRIKGQGSGASSAACYFTGYIIDPFVFFDFS